MNGRKAALEDLKALHQAMILKHKARLAEIEAELKVTPLHLSGGLQVARTALLCEIERLEGLD